MGTKVGVGDIFPRWSGGGAGGVWCREMLLGYLSRFCKAEELEEEQPGTALDSGETARSRASCILPLADAHLNFSLINEAQLPFVCLFSLSLLRAW